MACSYVGDNMNLVDVPFEGNILRVTPDYWFADSIRMPVDQPEAIRIARLYDLQLPTKEMVDAIWEYADLKLDPQPMTPGPEMTSDSYFVRHNNLIEEQINNRPFSLVAGHKKDILTPTRSDRVTIYGWHRQNGYPIQPVSTVHDAKYVDYSHGLRLVKLVK